MILPLQTAQGPDCIISPFWVPTPLNIIDLLDLMSTTGYVKYIERGPGRHGISNAFFLYILDPDGHRIEIYCSDYLTVDPDHEPIKWALDDPQRQTLWGAAAPKSWFEHGTEFVGVEISASDMKASLIIAPKHPEETIHAFCQFFSQSSAFLWRNNRCGRNCAERDIPRMANIASGRKSRRAGQAGRGCGFG